MKKLSAMDAGYLYAETAQTPMHVGWLSLLQVPPRRREHFYETYKAHIAARLHLMPVLRMKLMQVPYDIDHPVWVDDTEIDLDYHIRHMGLPRPGTMRQLEELVGWLHSAFLDRSRPLWEFYVIDGLPDNQVAIYTKLHHAAFDGGAGMVLTQVMYDTTPKPRKVEAPAQTDASKPPDPMALLDASYRNYVTQQMSTLQNLPAMFKAAAEPVKPDLAAWGSASIQSPPQAVPRTMLNVSITSQRSFTALSLPLDSAQAIAKRADCTLNEIVMALCAGALRRYLLDRDALPPEALVAIVPVSLREPGNTDTTNQISALLCSLATDIADPLQRLQAIAEASAQAKQGLGKLKNAAPSEVTVLGAPVWIQDMNNFASRARLADSLPPSANLVISNIRGPHEPLYLAGARMLTLYPVSIPAHGLALNITVQSYCESLDFGLTACRRSVPELGRLADYMAQSLVELDKATAALLAVVKKSAQQPLAKKTTRLSKRGAAR